jgi:hypothetical protein
MINQIRRVVAKVLMDAVLMVGPPGTRERFDSISLSPNHVEALLCALRPFVEEHKPSAVHLTAAKRVYSSVIFQTKTELPTALRTSSLLPRQLPRLISGC